MSEGTLNYADGQPIRIGDAVLDHDFVPKRVGDILYSDDDRREISRSCGILGTLARVVSAAS